MLPYMAYIDPMGNVVLSSHLRSRRIKMKKGGPIPERPLMKPGADEVGVSQTGSRLNLGSNMR